MSFMDFHGIWFQTRYSAIQKREGLSRPLAWKRKNSALGNRRLKGNPVMDRQHNNDVLRR